jgi:5'-nucleotidase
MPFLEALHRLQKRFPNRVRTGIFTSRDAGAVERCLRTLGSTGIDVDEAFPLAGAKKAPFLEKWQPDLYLDDQASHCGPASELGIPTVQVLGLLP